MSSFFFRLFSALESVYGGWILWNLFLAFIPLALSFILFQPKKISQPWLWGFCSLIGFIGAAGFLSRMSFVLRDRLMFLADLRSGDLSALLQASWAGVLLLITFGLSTWMMHHSSRFRHGMWWIGWLVFISFLPNAAYVLTDIIHLIRAIGSGLFSIWAITLVVIPIHVIAIFLGFEAYVISLVNQSDYLDRQGLSKYVIPAELVSHALCAVGVFLGRFIRLNSWDLVTDPTSVLIETFNTLTAKRPTLVIFITFIILTILYWIFKEVTLGLQLRSRIRQTSPSPPDAQS